MNEIRESPIEQYLDECMQRAGGATRKHASPGRRGGKDRLLFMPYEDNGERRALIWMCECKATDGKLSGLQIIEQRILQKYGVWPHVVASYEQVDELVKYMKLYAQKLTKALVLVQ